MSQKAKLLHPCGQARSMPVPHNGSVSFVLSIFLSPCWLLAVVARAQDASPPMPASVSAHQVVAEGHRLLRAGDPEAALLAYEKALKLAPEAPEIPFAQGLAHFKAKRFDEARAAFGKAAVAKNQALANDADYSLATCDHAQAMEAQDPKQGIARLESAMQQYHHVLSKDANHKAARDANLKAANLWKQLKHQLEQQQQQQQQQDGDNQEKKDQEKKDQQQQESKNEDQQQSNKGEDQEEQNQQESSSQQDEKQDQQQNQKQGQEQKDEKKEASESSEEQQPMDQKQAQAQEKEDASKEQAQRRLREMLQAMQQRMKARPEKVEKIPAQPVQKDW